MSKSIIFFLVFAAFSCQTPSKEPTSPRFNHVYLVVADLERSVDFYTQAFDLTEKKRIQKLKRISEDGTINEFDVNMALLKFSDQDFILEIAEREDFKSANDSVSYAHLGIDVQDIEVAEKRLLDAGATVLRNITLVQADDIEAKNSFYLGPDGETIELMQIIKGSF